MKKNIMVECRYLKCRKPRVCKMYYWILFTLEHSHFICYSLIICLGFFWVPTMHLGRANCLSGAHCLVEMVSKTKHSNQTVCKSWRVPCFGGDCCNVLRILGTNRTGSQIIKEINTDGKHFEIWSMHYEVFFPSPIFLSKNWLESESTNQKWLGALCWKGNLHRETLKKRKEIIWLVII